MSSVEVRRLRFRRAARVTNQDVWQALAGRQFREPDRNDFERERKRRIERLIKHLKHGRAVSRE